MEVGQLGNERVKLALRRQERCPEVEGALRLPEARARHDALWSDQENNVNTCLVNLFCLLGRVLQGSQTYDAGGVQHGQRVKSVRRHALCLSGFDRLGRQANARERVHGALRGLGTSDCQKYGQ